MTDFEGLVENDITNVGAMLTDIENYPVNVIHRAIVTATDDVLLGYFGGYPEARDILSARLDALLATGGTGLDSDTVQQYCQALIPLLADIDEANRVNGVAQALDQPNPELKQADNAFWEYLDQSLAVYNEIKIYQENTEWGLGDYLKHAMGGGGCNNVSVDWVRSVIEPYAAHGYVRPEEEIRDYLLTRVGIGV